MKLVVFRVPSTEIMRKAVAYLQENSAYFVVEPLPDGYYDVSAKPEHEKRLKDLLFCATGLTVHQARHIDTTKPSPAIKVALWLTERQGLFSVVRSRNTTEFSKENILKKEEVDAVIASGVEVNIS